MPGLAALLIVVGFEVMIKEARELVEGWKVSRMNTIVALITILVGLGAMFLAARQPIRPATTPEPIPPLPEIDPSPEVVEPFAEPDPIEETDIPLVTELPAEEEPDVPDIPEPPDEVDPPEKPDAT